jgi:ribonuclease HI
MALTVVDLWTDGSGTTLGHPGGWAYVLETVHPVTGQVHRKEGCGGASDTTNNRMEMTACLMGLRALRRSSLVVIHTDSEYLMKPFTEGWLETWVRKNFKKKQNADLWMLLREQVRRHVVTWEWVKGHSKIELNERCDFLAGQERRRIMAEGTSDQGYVIRAPEPPQGQLAVGS